MTRRTRIAAAASFVLFASVSAGCYNPDIKDGGLGCAVGDPRCPAGYECANRGDGDRCWKKGGGGGGGSGGNGGQGGSGGGGSGGGGSGGGGTAPDGPMTDAGCNSIPGCTPSVTSVCDPVCQVGCPCDQRCTVRAGTPVCSPAGARKLGETCNASVDNCEPGLVCLEDSCGPGGRGNRCYRFCRSHEHCGTPKAYCTLEIYFNNMPTGQKICDAPITNCNPVGAAATVGCGMYQGCYLIDADETGCDCVGTLDFGAACTYDRECRPGFLCTPGTGGNTCRRVCNIGVAADCAAGRLCRPVFAGSTRYGVCD